MHTFRYLTSTLELCDSTRGIDSSISCFGESVNGGGVGGASAAYTGVGMEGKPMHVVMQEPGMGCRAELLVGCRTVAAEDTVLYVMQSMLSPSTPTYRQRLKICSGVIEHTFHIYQMYFRDASTDCAGSAGPGDTDCDRVADQRAHGGAGGKG